MKGMTSKKAFLLAGIFLLATIMLVQLSWGCDDKDKWHCDHHGKPCHPPKIEIVYLDSDGNSIYFTILGKNFDNGVRPVVTLGGFYDLTVGSYSDNQIEATLPLPQLPDQFQYGDYKLVVSTCHNSKCKDKHCKDKYCKDHEYKCKCEDKYCLTIPGPPGTILLKIESETLELPRTELGQFKVSVECGSGFRVTGGGFSCLKCLECLDCLRIVVSEPLQDDKKNGIGWHVIGTYLGPVEAQLTIHAICVKVQ